MTVHFRFLDGAGSYHDDKDVEFDTGCFSADLMRRACYHWDVAHLQHIGRYNNAVVIQKFRTWLAVKYYAEEVMNAVPQQDFEFEDFKLRLLVWERITQAIKDEQKAHQKFFPQHTLL
ncbi:hypothetical protein PFICI_07467 [Pestalotiopsis fici W106-1]|uniref:Uncharacterized protein n=1 Tax=Pestalotiopsis fici (strain W106-1 / CGMCC3.15140) TaxID=1229662 RepID=W3X1D5_PESFW|nr:uncharacterized protein PFICI_07467 [Pestalotiopsis fici W106-1]ETS79938.1 hypothetical protein PFICI_07467 [Pestalotiopsis fici W106-1]